MLQEGLDKFVIGGKDFSNMKITIETFQVYSG